MSALSITNATKLHLPLTKNVAFALRIYFNYEDNKESDFLLKN